MEGSEFINPNDRESISEDGSHMIGGIEKAEELSLEELQAMYESLPDGEDKETIGELIRQKTEASLEGGE